MCVTNNDECFNIYIHFSPKRNCPTETSRAIRDPQTVRMLSISETEAVFVIEVIYKTESRL